MVHSYSNAAGSETASNAGGDDVAVATERTARLQPYERLLKKFNYQAALDAALKTRNPVVVITVLEELCRRNGLGIALSGRDETSLEPVVSFSARYVNHPKYSKLVIQVVQKMLDLYASVLGHSDAIDELFLKLHKQVRAEVGFQRQILRVMGSLDGIISTATMPRSAGEETIGQDSLLYA
jgi:U3 small nucleolar RNA-associated protein 15